MNKAQRKKQISITSVSPREENIDKGTGVEFGESSFGRKASKKNWRDSSRLTVGTSLQMAVPEQVVWTPFKVSRDK